MAKKPAESEESDETGSESGSAMGSQSEAASGEALDSDETGASDAVGSSETGATSEAESSGQSDGDESGETEATPKKKGAASGRAAASKRTTGKHASVKATAVRAAPRGSGHELVPVICSECYEELVFDSGVASPVLTCPICEHQAARPDDAQLAVIAEKRKQEGSNFKIGLILCFVSVAAFGVWIWLLRNPHTNANENGPAFYGPVAVSLLAYIGCLAFTVGKYEGARHDVYF